MTYYDDIKLQKQLDYIFETNNKSISVLNRIINDLTIKKEITNNIEIVLKIHLYKILNKKQLNKYEIDELKKVIVKLNSRNKKIIELIKTHLTTVNEIKIKNTVDKFIFNENLKIIKHLNRKNCYFCSYHKKDERKLGNILYETKNFYLKLGYGIITAGHIMIVSKQHLPCFGALQNKNHIKEFEELINKTCDYLKQTFNSNDIIMCEYGGCGQSVFHSHLHLIPATSNFKQIFHKNQNLLDNKYIYKYDITVQDIISMEKEYFKEKKCNFTETQIYSINDLTKCFKNKGAYIMYGSFNDREFTIFQPNNSCDYETMNSGLGYRGYFSQLGIAGVGDWKNQSVDDKILDTLKREETKKKLANIDCIFNNSKYK